MLELELENENEEEKEKKKNPPLKKTCRILKIAHLFITCQEVSRQEICGAVGKGWNDKTIFRDIMILRQAGMPIKYSNRQKAYVEDSKDSNTPLPAGRKARQYIEKIKRMTSLMSHMCSLTDEPIDVWYKENYPHVSSRTMHRDFALLNDIGYANYYKRKWVETPAERTYESGGEIYMDPEAPIGHYYMEEWWQPSGF